MIYCVITQFAERIISTKVKSQSIIALLWDFLFIFAGVMTTTLIIGLLIPLLGTMLGSAFVFFMKGEMSDRLQKSLLGFASGVMVAASVWSLLIPSMEMVEDSGTTSGV